MNIKVLLGETLVKVSGEVGGDQIIFETATGKRYKLYHSQSCCEQVEINDICGDLQDLVGSPILEAEESTSDTNPPGINPPEYQDCFLWTFYKLATNKGNVTVRWHGDSNGYYSVSVDFAEC
jgi:hypothetical protein